MSEGARLFRWAGCGGCHTDPAPAHLDLTDGDWIHGGRTPDIYGVIANGAPGMPALAERLTPQQIWQIAGYLHGLPKLKPEQRRRGDQALAGEPEGPVWIGALP
jgi:cytochrome c oxidase cbb3-type subunit 3